jgi:hypothetical protein
MKSFIMCAGHAVAQLAEALRYKPGGRGFDSRWCYDPGFDSFSKIKEYQEYFLGVKAAVVKG